MTRRENQYVTVGVLESTLEAMFERFFAESEKRILETVTTMIVEAEARILTKVETMITQSENDTAELISDALAHIDKRFDKLEKRMRQYERTAERVDNHSIRIGILEAKIA